MKILQITLSRFNDPYLDNALQFFYKLLKEIQSQYPDVVDSQLAHDRLTIIVKDRESLIDLLDDLIVREMTTSLRFSRQNKDGTITEGWKHFLIFPAQKPDQFPLTYREEKRRELLQKAFSQQPTSRRRSFCFLCGVFPATEQLTQGIYPFVTKAASLTTADYLVARGKKTYYYVCPLCYLIASLGWADPALPYRSRIVVAPRQRVSYLWLPYAFSLKELDRLKRDLPSELDSKAEISNIKLPAPQGVSPPGCFSLLLAFLEGLLLKVAQKEMVSLRDLRLEIPDEWWFIRIPEGRGMKNVDLGGFVLPQRVKDALIEYISNGEGRRLYGDFLGLVRIRDTGAQRNIKEERRRSDNLREKLSQSFLQDDYDSFARLFQPHPRCIISLPLNGEDYLKKLIKIWRCKDMLTEQELEILQKAGRTIALISDIRQKPSILYNLLDRVRTPSDLLDFLREIGHLLVGVDFDKVDFKKIDVKDFSPDAINQLVSLVNEKVGIFRDLKNTLGIFISVEYARRKLQERRRTE